MIELTKYSIPNNPSPREDIDMLQTQIRPTTQIRPLTTAHLAQTMALIELSAAELEQKVNAELSENPALEVNDTRRCAMCDHQITDSGLCPRCNPAQTENPEQPIIFVSPRYDYVSSSPDEDISLDRDIPYAKEDLPTFVLRQIAPELEPDNRKIAAFILSNLDDDGLLDTQVIEIARYFHVPMSRIEKVINQIQKADPIGVGSPSPQDALLVQLEVLAENQPIPAHTTQAIQEGMSQLSRHQYPELARKMGIKVHQVELIAKFISDNLNPFPGRAYWGDIRDGQSEAPPVYTYPDAIISPVDENPDASLVVEVFSPFAGILRVNPMFRQAIKQVSDENADQWKSDLGKAELLVKCLQQRTTTIVRLMRRLAILQRDFIINGDMFLHPLTRASLAEELDVHESTISRAVSNKAVQMPNGHIIPLAKFFDRSLQVRTALKQIIEQETTPLSDNDISGLLNEQGYSVARRTVAKYRAMEGILPSHLRQSQSAAEAK